MGASAPFPKRRENEQGRTFQGKLCQSGLYPGPLGTSKEMGTKEYSMSLVDDILPKKIVFKKLGKGNKNRYTKPSISIPRNRDTYAYANIHLGRLIVQMGYIGGIIHVDTENNLIGIQPSNSKDAHRLVANGEKAEGRQFSVTLGRKLPYGRYELMDELSSDEMLVFGRTHSKKD